MVTLKKNVGRFTPKVNPVSGSQKFKCSSCLAVYWDYYPNDDSCSICDGGPIYRAADDEEVTHTRRTVTPDYTYLAEVKIRAHNMN